jgi:hypothetical protein
MEPFTQMQGGKRLEKLFIGRVENLTGDCEVDIDFDAHYRKPELQKGRGKPDALNIRHLLATLFTATFCRLRNSLGKGNAREQANSCRRSIRRA